MSGAHLLKLVVSFEICLLLTLVGLDLLPELRDLEFPVNYHGLFQGVCRWSSWTKASDELLVMDWDRLKRLHGRCFFLNHLSLGGVHLLEALIFVGCRFLWAILRSLGPLGLNFL